MNTDSGAKAMSEYNIGSHRWGGVEYARGRLGVGVSVTVSVIEYGAFEESVDDDWMRASLRVSLSLFPTVRIIGCSRARG